MVKKVDDFATKSQRSAREIGQYWRIAKEIEKEKCVFCDLRDKYIICKNKYAVLTVNLFPYINGQLIVVPKRHIDDFSEISSNEAKCMNDLVTSGLKLLRDRLEIDNVWVILRNGNLAGKTVKHLHWNIMPYVNELNTWHYQEITITPVDLARKLRRK